MREPDNHTAWIDKFGDTWVRVDEHPGRNGTWWPLMDGTGWADWARNDVGVSRDWEDVVEYGPFVEAGPAQAAAALDRVREEASR